MGSLKELEHLTTLTVPKNALLGFWGNKFEGLDDSDDGVSDNENGFRETWPPGLTLDQILPAGVRELTIICEGKDIRDEEALLQDPVALRLEEMTAIDCQKEVWYTKTGGPNETQMERDRELALRRAALDAERRANGSHSHWIASMNPFKRRLKAATGSSR